MRSANHNRVRGAQSGAITLEYVLVCALLMLTVGFVVPGTMEVFRYAYQVIVAVICSPLPAGL